MSDRNIPDDQLNILLGDLSAPVNEKAQSAEEAVLELQKDFEAAERAGHSAADETVRKTAQAAARTSAETRAAAGKLVDDTGIRSDYDRFLKSGLDGLISDDEEKTVRPKASAGTVRTAERPSAGLDAQAAREEASAEGLESAFKDNQVDIEFEMLDDLTWHTDKPANRQGGGGDQGTTGFGTAYERANKENEALRKERRNFWIFTALIGLLVIAAVLYILWIRGIIFPEKPEPTTSSIETKGSTEAPATKPSESTSRESVPTEPTDPVPGSTEVGPTVPSSQQDPTPAVPDRPESVLEKYNQLFVVNTGTLNVRSGPTTNTNIVGTIDRDGGGEVLEYTENESGRWARISSGGITGYVSTNFILTGAEARTRAVSAARMRVKARVSVNVRSTPSTAGSDNVIATVPAGTVFTFIEESGDFYRVSYFNFYEGFVNKAYADYGYFLEEANRQY